LARKNPGKNFTGIFVHPGQFPVVALRRKDCRDFFSPGFTGIKKN
jgi:hypothetical protein